MIHKAARDLADAKNVVALTGAGVSVESGIPPFRGKGGLWEKFDPMEYAHIDAFIKDPAKVWNVLIKEMKEINTERTPLSQGTSDYIIMGKAGEIVKRLTSEIDRLL